jgi:glucokinase
LDGDIFANSLFKKMGNYLGIGVASLVNALGVETVVIGGGVSAAWDFFIETAKKELSQRTYEETAKSVKLLRAELGTDAALMGAGASFFA